MSKLLSTLLAGAAALALSGSVIAADQQSRDNQTEAQPNATQGKPDQRDAERVQQGQSQDGSATTADRQSQNQSGSATTDQQSQNQSGSATTDQQSQNQSGSATTDQQNRNDSARGNQSENQAGQTGTSEDRMSRNPDQPGGDMSAKDKEYSAELKKCDSMPSEQKRKCIDVAKKKHSQM